MRRLPAVAGSIGSTGSLLLATAIAAAVLVASGCGDSGSNAEGISATLPPGALIAQDSVEAEALAVLGLEGTRPDIESAVMTIGEWSSLLREPEAAGPLEADHAVWVVLVHESFQPQGPTGSTPTTYEAAFVVFDAQTGDVISRGGTNHQIALDD